MEDEVHCILNNTTKRPLCGKPDYEDEALDEDFGKGLDKGDINKFYREYNKRMNAWERWSKKHRVDPHGICDCYLRKDKR